MSVDQLPYAHGGPVATAKVRSCPEDFQVYEDLGFEPTGEGQHRMIEIEKRDLNSDWVASQIAADRGKEAGRGYGWVERPLCGNSPMVLGR